MYSKAQIEWLEDNYSSFSEKKLAELFNQIFNEGKNPRTLGTYCRNCLGLVRDNPRGYSEVENLWLKDNFPKLGREACAKQFKARFGRDKKARTLERYCRKQLGLSVSVERLSKRYDNFTKPVGSISKNCRGEWKIKTEEGWVNYARSMFNDVPEGHIVVHLDCDQDNNEKDNLVVIRNGVQTSLRNLGMWSENADITRTSIKWFELKEALEINEIKEEIEA